MLNTLQEKTNIVIATGTAEIELPQVNPLLYFDNRVHPYLQWFVYRIAEVDTDEIVFEISETVDW